MLCSEPPNRPRSIITGRRSDEYRATARGAPFYERAIAAAQQAGDTIGTIHTYQNLSEVYFYVGPASASASTAHKALELSRGIGDKEEERDFLAYQGWAAHLSGDLVLARTSFQEAETLQGQINPDSAYVSDRWGGVAGRLPASCGGS